MKKANPIPLTLQESLVNLGFSKNAARVVENLLHTHHGNASAIAKMSDMPRTTVYGALSELVEKNIVVKKKIRGKHVWEIIAPAVFAKRLKKVNAEF